MNTPKPRNSMIEQELEETYRSITELTNELARAKEQAEAASRAKSDFLAKMSHELRTPLNSVLGYSEIIKDNLMGSCNMTVHSEYATIINNTGQHLLNIINDILDLSKIETGENAINEDEIDLAELARACFNIMKVQFDENEVQLVHNVSSPPPTLHGDVKMVRQMLLNLLSNAVKFTPRGGAVTVNILTNREGELVLSVCDTGTGIPEDELETVMLPFEQATRDPHHAQEGTGLGLSIVASMAEIHGGTFSVRNNRGAGVTAKITFPGSRLASNVVQWPSNNPSSE